HFNSRPAVYESRATVRVAGAAADAESDAVTSPTVLGRAARKLDEEKPFEAAPPPTEGQRVAYLREHLAVQPDRTADGPPLALAFRDSHRYDAGKYLRTVVEAYQAEVASRDPGASPAAAPTPTAPAPGTSTPAPDDRARVDAD